jgi:hypothetical protein
MTPNPIPNRLRLWLLAALLAVKASPAHAQVVADDPVHQRVMHALVNDPDVFPVTKSGGFVKGASPAAASALKARFKRLGVDADDIQAAALIDQVLVRSKGRVPSDIDAGTLLSPYKEGHKTHGDLAEVDVHRIDPARYGFSKGNSVSADGSIYENGKIVGHWQSKCEQSLTGSRDGILKDFKTFLRKDYRIGAQTPFEGFIPKDQYDELLRTGVIDADGRFRDLSDLRSRVMKSPGPDPARSLDPETLRQLQFKPLPKPYAEYPARMNSLARDAKIGAYTHRSTPTATSRHVRGAALLAAVFELGSFRLSEADGLSTFSTAAAVMESTSTLKPSPRDAKRFVERLPQSARSLVPSSRSLGKVGRGAGVAGILITAGIVGWDIYKYSSGQMSTRDFQTSMASSGGGLAGGLGGAFVGAKIGVVGGPLGVAVGAVIGGAIGGLSGAFFGESVVGGYWASLDAEELEYSIRLIEDKIRRAGIPLY